MNHAASAVKRAYKELTWCYEFKLRSFLISQQIQSSRKRDDVRTFGQSYVYQ